MARSGKTHSLLGLAKTLPELLDVSLDPDAGATAVAGGFDVEGRGVVAAEGRPTIAAGAEGLAFTCGGRDAMAGVPAAGRGCIKGRPADLCVCIGGRGWSDGGAKATDMV